MGDTNTAVRHSEESLEICQRLGSPIQTAYAAFNLGTTLQALFGQFDRVLQLYEQVMYVFKDLGVLQGQLI